MTDAHRRDFLRGVVGAGATLTAVGTVSASDGGRQYVVTGRRGVAERLEQSGYAVRGELAGGRVVVAAGDAAPTDVDGVKAVAPDRRLRLDEPEFVEAPEATTDEQLFEKQWDKRNTDVPEAHEISTGEGGTVAIIDTGVDYDHPDLATNVNTDESRLFREGEVLRGEGEIVLKDGSTETDYVFDDVYGHGSHVSGIAAGSDDGTTGVVGTAPDAEIVSLRVFYYTKDGALATTTGDILTAIDYAARIGVDAMNMSIGTPPQPPQNNAEGDRTAYRTVINEANRRGSVVIVSAGNADADLQHGGYFTVPNSVSGATSVSATGPNEKRVFYSNYGTNELAVGAPGGGYETREKTLKKNEEGNEDDVDEPDVSGVEWPYPTNLVLFSVPPEYYGGSTPTSRARRWPPRR